MEPSCSTYDPGLSRYGARNAVSAASASSGASSGTQWALLVLRDGGVECAVDREAGVQGIGAGGQGVYVVADRGVGQFLGSLGGELPAEVDGQLHARYIRSAPGLPSRFRLTLDTGRSRP